MGYGCESCYTSARGQDEQLLAVKAKAEQYAKEKQTTVAIYREGYDIKYCIAKLAISERYNIIEVVSKHN